MRDRALVAFGLVLSMAALGCGPRATSVPPPSRSAPPPSPAWSPGQAVLQTRTAIAEALGARQVQLDDAEVPYRPGEAAPLMSAPRVVYKAVLPADTAHGFIVVYEFPDARTAQQAAQAQANYVGSPVGRVQFSFGTRFIVRQLGQTVIFYADPPESPDDQAPDVVEALQTVGTEITVPS